MTTRALRLCGLLVLLALIPSVARAAGTETTQYQADAAHSGYVYGAGVVPPLRQAWVASTGANNDYPVIDAGRVFALAEPGSSQPMRVDAFDLAGGQVAWSQPLTGGSYPYLAVDGGRVYAVAEVAGPGQDGTELWAFNESTGTLDWSEVLPGGQYMPTPPVAASGTVYISSGGVGDDVLAVRESDGAVLWHVTGTEGSGLVLAGGTVVLAGVCGNSMGFDAATGAVRWHDNPGCDGGGVVMPSFDGIHAWAPALSGGDTGPGGTEGGEIYAPASGAVAGTFLGTAPAFGYGEAALIRTPNQGPAQIEVAAIDPASQAVRWSAPGLGAGPLLADGKVFSDSYTASDVVALDPCSGAQVWRAPLPAPPQGEGLAAGDGYLVVPVESGLVAFHSATEPPPHAVACIPSGGTGGGGTGSGGLSSHHHHSALLRLRAITCRRSHRVWRCVLTLHASRGTLVDVTIGHGRRTIARASGRVRRGQARAILRLRGAAHGKLPLTLVLMRGRRRLETVRTNLVLP